MTNIGRFLGLHHLQRHRVPPPHTAAQGRKGGSIAAGRLDFEIALPARNGMAGAELTALLSFPRQPLGTVLLSLLDQMLEGLSAQYAGKAAQPLLPETLPIPVLHLAAVREMLLSQAASRSRLKTS